MSRQFTRREVIKTFAVGAAFSNVIGQSWASPVLHELKPLSHLQNGLLKVNMDEFPALAQPLGSVRISTSPLNARGERQLGLFAPVIINRSAEGEWFAMSAACTHEDCTVRRLDANSQRMLCPCHGSQFAVDGSRIQGPAAQPLLKYNFQLRGSILEIELPDVFFEITARRIPASNRVELTFIAFEQIIYEIHFRETLTGPTTRVPFSTTANGPLDQVEYPGQSDLPTLFVEKPGTAGIFQIVMQTRAV